MMNMKKLNRFLLAVLFSVFTQSLFAQATFHKEIPDLPSKPALVNDLGDMLTTEEEMKLEAKLLKYEQESSNEIAIVTVETLGGMEVADFAVELGRKWGIGKSSKKNGVLVLASKTDRKINISPGYGLQGVLPDVRCSRIIREQIVPNFKSGNIYAGFDQATDKIIAYSTGEFSAEDADGKKDGSPLLFILFFMLMVFVFFFVVRKRTGNTYVSRRGYRNTDAGWGAGGGFFGGMMGGSGSSWGSDDSGGGGFGGFGGGGGGFDGGGASGSW